MAIKNFIINGSYSRIERFDYSKHFRFINVGLAIYEDSTLTRCITTVQLQINGCYIPTYFSGYITDEETLLDPSLITCDKYFVNIADPQNDFAKNVNHKLIYRSQDDRIILEQPEYYYSVSESKYYRFINDSLTELNTICTNQQFDDYFKVTENLIKLTYKYLLTLPEFSGSISDE